MQHDNHYDHHARPRTTDEPTHTVAKASGAFGTAVAWILIGLVGVLFASGLIALIVMLWRVIL